MRKSEIEVGRRYEVRVSGKLVTVKLLYTHPNGGWVGMNEATKRLIRFKTAGRFRFEVTE